MNVVIDASWVFARLSLLLLALGSVVAEAQRYPTLAEKIHSGDSQAFAALRRAFLREPDAAGRLERLEHLHANISEVSPNAAGELRSLAREMLDLYYGDLRAHALLHRLELAAGNDARARRHADARTGVLTGIRASGDGSAKAPYQVVSTDQARAYLAARRLEVVGSRYAADDDARSLKLVTRVRQDQERGLEEIHFDLTSGWRVRAASSGSGNGEPSSAYVAPPSKTVARLAAQGDPAALAAHALRLWRRGPEQAQSAINMLQDASEQGNLVAREVLGVIYGSLASGRPSDEGERLTDAAVDQFLLAVGQGSASAMFNMAQIYLSGHFGEENRPAGVALLRQASARGNLDAMVLLARLRYDGQYTAKDVDAALVLLRRAAQRGQADAKYFYARHVLATDEGAAFDEQALRWLTAAARNDGDPRAMLLLGNLYADGKHVEGDLEQAKRWFVNAGQQSRQAATVNAAAWVLAVAEREGLRDPARARQLMERLMNGDEAARSNPAYLDTWAATYAATGKYQRAVALQREAIDQAREQDRDDYMPDLEAHLEAFENGRPLRQAVPQKAPDPAARGSAGSQADAAGGNDTRGAEAPTVGPGKGERRAANPANGEARQSGPRETAPRPAEPRAGRP